MEQNFPEARKIFPPPGEDGGGAGVLDRVYEIPGPPRQFIIAEAKGGSATNTSSRQGDPHRMQQGRRDYLEDVLRSSRMEELMPEDQRVALSEALKTRDRVRYLEVSQKLTDAGQLDATKVREYVLNRPRP